VSGIVGIVNLDDRPLEQALLHEMTQVLTYHAPDGCSVWADQQAGLGHALLRTTFESKNEKQPCSLNGQVWITADARVDSRAELIDKLRARHCDVSNLTTDVELILHAYHVWNQDCVQHLIGDWAFAIWDGPQQRLFCARDQFGVTPFYYALGHECFVFSNTLNCLHLHPDISDRLNEYSIGDYLLFGYNQEATTTTFSDIQCLPPAHSMTVSNGVPRLRRYWTLPEKEYDGRRLPAEEVVEGFREVFRQAVSDRLRAERVIATISGGMDSTSIAAVAYQERAQGVSPTEVCAYSGGFDWLLPDHERYYAGLAARQIGIPIHYLSAERYMRVNNIDEAWHLGPEPRFPARPAPALEILECAAACDTRVVLFGVGGDPAFSMPPSYWRTVVRRGQIGRAVSEGVSHLRAQGRPSVRQVCSYLLPHRWLRRLLGGQRPTGMIGATALPQWIDPVFADRLDLRARFESVKMQQAPTDGRHGMASQPLWANSLSSGHPEFTSLPVKLRNPFFDVRLLNYLLTVPPVPWFVDKGLLREAMRGILPESVRCRRKTPLSGDFFQASAIQGWEPWLEELAATPELAEYVNRDWLLQAVKAPEEVPVWQFSRGVMQPLSLAYWLRNRHRLCAKSRIVA
jgi:asparagine synthase (glutamine-hydrolysing)